MPASSASPELKAMVFCVVGHCVTARNPLTRAPPQVDRRVCTSKVSARIRAEGGPIVLPREA
eukprot:142270-Alexandrium_andersonii.AAC.1